MYQKFYSIEIVRKFLVIFDGDFRATFASKFVSLLLGPITSFIIVWCLSIDMQGLYYLFVSITGLRTIFDFGLSSVIGQLTPHNLDRDTGKINDIFYQTSIRFVRNISILYFLIVWPLGSFYFNTIDVFYDHLQLAWVFTILIQSIKGCYDTRLMMFANTGQIEKTSKFHIKLNLIQIISQSIFLISGCSIFSFALASLICLLVQLDFLRKENFLLQSSRINTLYLGQYKTIKSEIFSLMKRAGFTYLSGYAVFQIQVPIISAFCGTKGSAVYGFTSNIGGILTGLSSIWISTKFPIYAKMISDNSITSAKNLFAKCYKLSVLTLFLSVFATYVLYFTLLLIPKFAERLASNSAFIIILLFSVVQNMATAITYWPRACRAEPFSKVAILQMLITPLLAYFGAKYYNIEGLVLGNLISWILGGIYIFHISKKYWISSKYISVK